MTLSVVFIKPQFHSIYARIHEQSRNNYIPVVSLPAFCDGNSSKLSTLQESYIVVRKDVKKFTIVLHLCVLTIF